MGGSLERFNPGSTPLPLGGTAHDERRGEVRSRSYGGPLGGDMNSLDWVVLIGYFGVMVGIGFWSHKRVDNVSDFFTAGGKMPWWLSGISHHMSGYSAVMFTGYAAIAYQY